MIAKTDYEPTDWHHFICRLVLVVVEMLDYLVDVFYCYLAAACSLYSFILFYLPCLATIEVEWIYSEVKL